MTTFQTVSFILWSDNNIIAQSELIKASMAEYEHALNGYKAMASLKFNEGKGLDWDILEEDYVDKYTTKANGKKIVIRAEKTYRD